MDAYVNALFEDAKKSLCLVSVNQEFTLRGLFRGITWDKISKANRTALGGLFKAYIEEKEYYILIGKTAQNSYIYKRIK